MVARGDLGNECSIEDLPHLQKMIIRECIAVGRPVITATQMLDSMQTNELPTRAEPFAANPLVFVASPMHPLAGESGLRAEDLRQQLFIVREPGSGTRSAMESFFSQARLQPRYSMELQSNDAIKQAVMANLGLGFLSLHTIALELQTRKLCVLQVNGAPLVRAWNVVHTLSKFLSPAAEAFRYFVLEHAETDLAAQFGELRQSKS